MMGAATRRTTLSCSPSARPVTRPSAAMRHVMPVGSTWPCASTAATWTCRRVTSARGGTAAGVRRSRAGGATIRTSATTAGGPCTANAPALSVRSFIPLRQTHQTAGNGVKHDRRCFCPAAQQRLLGSLSAEVVLRKLSIFTVRRAHQQICCPVQCRNSRGRDQ